MLHAHKILEDLSLFIDKVTPDMEVPNISKEQINNIMAYNQSDFNAITSAVKFDLGHYSYDDISTLSKLGAKLLEDGVAKLPFETCYFEIGVQKNRWGILITPIVDYAGFTFNIPTAKSKYILRMFAKGRHKDHWSANEQHIALSEDFKVSSGPMPDDKSQKYTDMEKEMFDHCCRATITAAIYLLNSGDATIVKEEAPEKLNKRRLNKGRTPLFSHHVVKIGGVSKTGGVIPLGGTHASPRAHDRMGHIRTYHRGTDKEFKRWISDTKIEGRGKITKQYEVLH
jgi:hypothetical protein